MSSPLVSIIIPVYNAAATISGTVHSVLRQTYPHFEIILVDDASSDNSLECITAIAAQHKAITIITLARNGGPGVARNKGIERAKGKYIAFLDADDRWFPEKLEKQIAFMQAHNYLLTYTWYNTADKNGNIIIKKITSPVSTTYRQLLKQNTIGNLTAIYDCEALGKMYMPELRLRQDWGLWLDILKTGITAYGLQEVLATYRTSGNSLSANKWKVGKYNWIILRKYQKLSVFVSAYYFLHFILHKSKKYLFQ